MADGNDANRDGGLYLILGGVIVVLIFGFLYFNGNLGGRGGDEPDVNITVPAPSPSAPAVPSAPAPSAE